MNTGKLFCCLSSILLLTCACGPAPDIRALYETDCRSPELLSIGTETGRSLTILFDEPAAADPSDIHVRPALGIETVRSEGEKLICTFTESQKPGKEYIVEGRATDGKGNTLNFMSAFYGKNTDLPALLINEFTTKGTGNHPDCVEIAVLSGGNPAGIMLCDGTVDSWSLRFVFPDMRLQKGDFLVVHFKPQGIPEELDEISDKGLSRGCDATGTAFDFWVKGGTGLSSNNGVIVLYGDPTCGNVLDCVIYSNRTAQSDEKYGGFGSQAMQTMVEKLRAAGAWKTSGGRAVPEDMVNPEPSTGTRSICRSPQPVDTDTRSDWYVVETKCATFGSANSGNRYCADERK